MRSKNHIAGLVAIILLATIVLVGCGEGRGVRSGGEVDGTGVLTGGETDAEESTGPRESTVAGAHPRVVHEGTAAAELWLCPMHPTYVSDHKGACPICGMDLVPASEFQAGESTGIPGMASVVLSDEGIRLAGVRTQQAEMRSLETSIRTVGVVTPDESLIHRVHIKVPGWVEQVFIEATGQAVRRGDPMLSIYSPMLLIVQEEFLRAREARRAAQGPEAGRAADLLVEAARRRLALFDVPSRFIDELEQRGEASRTVVLEAPASGVVTAREVYAGQQVEPGMQLFAITDLDRVWVEGSFYEGEARTLAEGQPVDLRLPYDPTVALTGEVDFIYPYLDPQSRTLRVRFVFDNPFGILKPGMYANLLLRSDLGEGVVIPENAILDTGERSIVFVHAGEGVFVPREVDVAARAGGEAQIFSGLEPGEEVVVRANFLLDSESRIRAVLAGGAGAQTPRGGHAEEAHDGGGAR